MENNCLSYYTSEQTEAESLRGCRRGSSISLGGAVAGSTLKGGVSTAFPVMGVMHGVGGRLGAACSRPLGRAAGAVATDLPSSLGEQLPSC